MTQQNVLFFITDQQRADHVGFAANPVVSTPDLDGLADRSTVFDRAFVSNPVCMPNRSTIMVGRMPSARCVIFNDRSLSPGANTFVRELRANGYSSALIGKSHLQHGISPDANIPFPGEPGLTEPWPAGWNAIEHIERYESEELDDPDDFYGFGQIELTLGHPDQVGGHQYRWPASMAPLMTNWLPGSPPPTTCPSSHRTGDRSMRRGSPKSSTPPTSSPNEQPTS